jgi:hypothetical protein
MLVSFVDQSSRFSALLWSHATWLLPAAAGSSEAAPDSSRWARFGFLWLEYKNALDNRKI